MMPYAMLTSVAHDRLVQARADEAKSWQSWQAYPDGTFRVDFRDGFRIPDPSGLRSDVRMLHRLGKSCIISSALRLIVAQQVRDAIEAIEPGVHQFFQAQLTPLKGDVIDVSYHILNVCHRLRAIDGERTAVPFTLYDDGARKVYSLLPRSQFVLRSDVVAGKAVWRDEQAHEFFISDALHDVIASAGARNVDLTRVELS